MTDSQLVPAAHSLLLAMAVDDGDDPFSPFPLYETVPIPLPEVGRWERANRLVLEALAAGDLRHPDPAEDPGCWYAAMDVLNAQSEIEQTYVVANAAAWQRLLAAGDAKARCHGVV